MKAAWQQLRQLAEPHHQSFTASLNDTATTQQQLLLRLLQQNQHCQLGQQLGFKDIDSIQHYQATVPIQQYQQLAPQIEQMLLGQQQVLFEDQALWYERTSGTTDSAKMIPYTPAALTAFQSALFPWLYDLMAQYPDIMQGSAYWSISPVGRAAERTPDGTPIGSHNDALYLGQQAAELINQTLAVPVWVAEVQSIEAWQYITLRYLLSNAHLSLISIWSPSFLLQLLKALPTRAAQLIQDIHNGQVSEPGLQAHQAHFDFVPNPQRATWLRSCITKDGIDTLRIWPQLALISCWSSASSAVYAEQLQQLFKTVPIQAKGLLATEGAVTVPCSAAAGPALAIQSGFFEFIDASGEVHLAEHLHTGQSYEVVMSNFSGLYRYRIGDRVRVVGWHHTAPCLEFIGRSGSTVDLCGEKLTEAFVLPLLQRIPGFSMLVANPLPKPHYCLYVDARDVNEPLAAQLRPAIEQQLQGNPQYQYARHLGQLNAVKIIRTAQPMNRYYQQLQQLKNLGDIKPPGLSQDLFWHQCFAPTGVIDEQPLSV